MAKRKQEESGGGGAPAWMATFSDLMNLLLCFFVLLFSMSSVEQDKWEQVVASMSSAFSIFNGGTSTIGEGAMVGMGTSQLSELDEYYSDVGQAATETGEDAKNKQDSKNSEGGKTKDDNQGGKTPDDNESGKKPDDSQGGKTPEDEDSGKKKDENQGGKTPEDEDAGKKPDDSQGGKTPEDEDAGKKPDDSQGGKTPEDEDAGKKKDQDVGGKSKNEDDGGKTLIDQLNALGRAETEEMLDSISEMTERYNIGEMLEVSMDQAGKYVEITLSGSMLFESGSAELQTSCLPLLSKVGDILKVYSKHDIDIIGHTDNVPMKSSTFKDNDMLSSARAISAAQYLVKEKGVDVKRLSWTGRGEYEPVASNATAEGRARNRRIEIRIYNSYSSN